MLPKKIASSLLLAWLGFSLLALPLGLISNRETKPTNFQTKKDAAAGPAPIRLQPEVTKKQNVLPARQATIAQPAKAVAVLPAPVLKPTLPIKPRQTNPLAGNHTIKSPSPKAMVSPYQFQMLARIISAEAKGEPFHGQVAVGAVILNRVASGHFPKTIAANVLKHGQFEPVANGSIWNKPAASAYRAARLALKGWDPTGGALYFFNPAKTSSHWIWSRPIVKRIGDHVFAV